MNTTEKNKIIAEFMGVKETFQGAFEMYGVIAILDDGENEQRFYFPSELRFHSDWNWLMPVIKKCLEGEAEHTEGMTKETIKVIYENLCDQNITETLNSCVRYIIWHNQQNK